MLKVRQVKLSVLKDNEFNLKTMIAKKLHVTENNIVSYKVRKKSIDARAKNNILYIYEVEVDLKNEKDILLKNKSADISLLTREEYECPNKGNEKLTSKIVIVGSGPAGLFAAYLLAKNGYNPIILERGEQIEKRVSTVERFWASGNLDLNSNVQFGEGGAGTFSDGKLNTLTNDKFFRNQMVLETFVKFGAPEDILYLQKPHIGTDILRSVIVNMRQEIEKLGGKFYYNSCLTNIFVENNSLKSIEINNCEKMNCSHLILAIGHSARDTFSMLYDNNLDMQAKPFAVGIRIQHPQEVINESQYGNFAKILPPASYKLTYNTKQGRGVYSFCMCPGGFVVNASSEKNYLAINGMSNYKRDTKVANSAIVVSVSPHDFGSLIFDGINFQRELERKAYLVGKGNIPVQLYKDYKTNKLSTDLGSFKPCMKGSYTFANLNKIFPNFINDSLKEAIEYFGKKINHFNDDDIILAGVESRTSSPIKIYRDENFESNIKGIYPCGEGAGYAGGIMTSAVDGLKVSESIICKYSNV